MTEQLFISDLHLSTQRTGTVELFMRFLTERCRNTAALFILGDLFDAWIGDDDTTPPAPEIRSALYRLSQQGTRVFIQHGNRDFLIGSAFADQSGAQLIDEEHCIELGEVKALLMHGDLLCSDDTEYLQARAILRSPAFIEDFLSKPVEIRAQLAAEYRKRSGEVVSLKPQDIMDVNADTVVQFMRKHNATTLIHGHTHRPGAHHLQYDGLEGQRFVLGDWHEDHVQYLSAINSQIKLEKFS